MTEAAVKILEKTQQPVRKAIRRLRWFIDSFQEQIQQTSTETGVVYHVDEQKLVAVFLDWLRAFEAQKPADPDDRRPYVAFAAGLMLRTLINRKPVTVVSKPDGADDRNPAFFWPEGYAYVAYCLNVRSAVLERDFHEDQQIVPEPKEISTWWSFKENTDEDPSLSIAFLHLFAGDTPEWSMPGIFQSHQVKELASRFYEPKHVDDV